MSIISNSSEHIFKLEHGFELTHASILMLTNNPVPLCTQVDVSPGEIYGGFARNCRARTVNDADDEALYTVTDDNGCATDPDIFSEWKYDRINGHLTAIFDAFKFPDR